MSWVLYNRFRWENTRLFSGKSAEIRLVKVNERAGLIEVVFAGDSLRTRGKDESVGCGDPADGWGSYELRNGW